MVKKRFKLLKRSIGWIVLVTLTSLGIYQLKPRKEPVKKLYKTNTGTGRPVIYLKDENGKVELVNSRDIELIERLSDKYEVIENTDWRVFGVYRIC